MTEISEYEYGDAFPVHLRAAVTQEQLESILEPIGDFVARTRPDVDFSSFSEKPHWVLGPVVDKLVRRRAFGWYAAR